MELKIIEGVPPSKLSADSEDAEIIKKIVNLLEVTSEDNNWLHSEIEICNYTRFRSAFTRYCDKFNKEASPNLPRKFRMERQGQSNNYKIWRTI